MFITIRNNICQCMQQLFINNYVTLTVYWTTVNTDSFPQIFILRFFILTLHLCIHQYSDNYKDEASKHLDFQTRREMCLPEIYFYRMFISVKNKCTCELFNCLCQICAQIYCIVRQKCQFILTLIRVRQPNLQNALMYLIYITKGDSHRTVVWNRRKCFPTPGYIFSTMNASGVASFITTDERLQ